MGSRRNGSFGAVNGSGMDVESLERENDRGISALSERISLLKSATHGIRDEVESQHHVLDRMGDSMMGTRGVLGNAADKFKVVMNDKQNRKLITTVAGIAVVLFVLYYMFHR